MQIKKSKMADFRMADGGFFMLNILSSMRQFADLSEF